MRLSNERIAEWSSGRPSSPVTSDGVYMAIEIRESRERLADVSARRDSEIRVIAAADAWLDDPCKGLGSHREHDLADAVRAHRSDSTAVSWRGDARVPGDLPHETNASRRLVLLYDNYFGWIGRNQHGGPEFVEEIDLWWLLHNIAIAGALEHAFRLGDVSGDSNSNWRSNIDGRPAPVTP